MALTANRCIDRSAVCYLLVVLVLAGFLRGLTLGESLWTDELHTSWTVVGDLSEVGPRARIGNNSPTYFYAIWLVSKIFGHSEIAYRSLSWLAGLGLIIVAYFYAIRWTESKVIAVFVSTLMAIDSNLIFYSAEARPYAVLQLCMLFSTVHFFEYCSHGSRTSRLIWISTLILGFHLHYTSLLLLAGQLAFAAIVLLYYRKQNATVDGFRPATIVIDLIIVTAIIAFSSQHLFMIAGRRQNWAHFVHAADWISIFNIFKTTRLVGIAILLLLVQKVIEHRNPKTQTSQTEWQCKNDQIRILILFFACCFLVPVMGAFIVNNLDIARLFFRRYLVSVIAPLYLTLALTTALSSAKFRIATAVLAVTFAVGWSTPIQTLLHGRQLAHSSEDWRGAIEKINETDRESVVVLRTGLIEEAGRESLFDSYEQFPVRAIYSLDASHPCVTLPLTTKVDSAFDLNSFTTPIDETAWLLIRGRQSTCDSVTQAVVDSTESSNQGIRRVEVIEEFHFGRNIHLIRIKIE